MSSKGRIKFYFLVILITFAICIFRLIYLQTYLRTTVNKVSNYSKKAKRGSIFTSDNLEIALDLEYYNMQIDPVKIKDADIENLLKIIVEFEKDINYTKTLEEIKEFKRKNKRNYDFNKKIIYVDSIEKIKEKMEIQKINAIIYFTKKYKRKYVDNSIFETIVGYINNVNEGMYGLEKFYNDKLVGIDGEYEGFRPYDNKYAEYTLPYLIGEKEKVKKVDGNNLKLSINSIIQYSLDEILQNVFLEYDANTVMGTIMESDTGRIIAMSSYPKANNKGEIKNHNIADSFEPGSIFKPITVAAAINDSKINENTLIHSDGFIKVRNRIIRDHDDSTKGLLPVSKIMAHSGNVGIVKISQLLEPINFYEYISRFNFGKKLGIDINYEMTSKLMSFKNFTEVRRSNVSFGQGINITQLQMLTALNATINGGKILKPRLVDKIYDEENKVIEEFDSEILSRPISEATSFKIRNMLKDVVESGTGRAAKIEGYTLGGKTGTAQKAGNNGYEYGKYFSSFFMFFPADKPKYSILITVDEPKGSYYGATVALPAARSILERIIKYENIKPTEKISDEIKDIKTTTSYKVLSLQEINESISNNIMPNLLGVTKRIILDSKLKDYNLKFEGNGSTIYQNIEVGEKIDKNSKILLKLE